MSEKGMFDKLLSNALSIIYSPEKKFVRYVLLLTLIGFVLRLIAALNLDAFADDMIYASQSAGIFDAKILSTHSNPPLFFYLTDLIYGILGYSTFASRFWPLIAGTMLIPLSFLITQKFFNEKIALFAAFLVTFSSFLVRMTFNEQSLVVLFFVFFGVYSGIRYLENKSLKWLLFSGIGFGLGLLTKYSAPFFILAFLVFAYFKEKEKKEAIFSKKHIKHLLIFLLIIFLFALPILAFNYFIYQEKGIVDVYFSRVINVEKAQQLYGSLAGQETSFFQNLLNPNYYSGYKVLYKNDLLISLFGLLGLGLLVKRKEKIPLKFILLFLIIPFILQSGGSALQKHFAFLPFIFAIPAAYGLNEFINKTSKKTVKIIMLSLITLIMIMGLGSSYGTPSNYLSKSGTASLKSFINNNVGVNDLVILDSRIYTSESFWLVTPNNFLLLQQFPEFYNYNQNLSNKVDTKVYVVECVIDDCGWGWVQSNQEFNKSSEDLLDVLKQNTKLESSIKENKYGGNEIVGSKEEIEEFRIYSINIPLNQDLVKQTKQIQNFYFVPYLYKNLDNYVFNYDVYGVDRIVNKLSLYIIYISMILAILILISILFLL